MPNLKFAKESYVVDYAEKGSDFIAGYKNGKELCRFEGIKDFSYFEYDSVFRLPQTSVNEMIKESEVKSLVSDEAIVSLQEAIDTLSDRLDSALIDASFGEITQTVHAFVRQINKHAISVESVPDKYKRAVEDILRASK